MGAREELARAMGAKRAVALVYDGAEAEGEPRGIGTGDEGECLYLHRTDAPAGRIAAGWRRCYLDRIESVRITEDEFPGPRPSDVLQHPPDEPSPEWDGTADPGDAETAIEIAYGGAAGRIRAGGASEGGEAGAAPGAGEAGRGREAPACSIYYAGYMKGALIGEFESQFGRGPVPEERRFMEGRMGRWVEAPGRHAARAAGGAPAGGAPRPRSSPPEITEAPSIRQGRP